MERDGVDEQRMTAEEILHIWEAKRRPLTPEQRESFLARREVKELATLPAWAVERGLHRHRKLLLILMLAAIEARSGQPPSADPSALEEALPDPQVDSWRIPYEESRKCTPPPKVRTAKVAEPQTRPSARDGSSLPPLLRGTKAQGSTRTGGAAGSRSTYSSGLARSPGATEQTVVERCSQCGKPIPNGSAHDC
jgi:hypothetical protein